MACNTGLPTYRQRIAEALAKGFDLLTADLEQARDLTQTCRHARLFVPTNFHQLRQDHGAPENSI